LRIPRWVLKPIAWALDSWATGPEMIASVRKMLDRQEALSDAEFRAKFRRMPIIVRAACLVSVRVMIEDEPDRADLKQLEEALNR
jgi:hypothetical protein